MSVDPRIAEYQTRLQSALEALQKMRARVEAAEARKPEAIAVIGIGCRYPGGANSPEAFWQLLVNGVDAIREVPPERWDIDALFDSDPQAPGKINSRWGGFLDDIDQFDAQFFGISPREARSMDPQQRLLMEVSWQALEHAGLNPAQLSKSQTGVFVGVTTSDYLNLQNTRQEYDQIDAYRITGNSLNSTAGRLSYFLGLHGPSAAVDTACSSSLVAVHLACQSLRTGESNLALACGVNLILSPEMSISATKASMLAPDGRCKAFDSRANGFVRSEGCGVVVLKRLSEAVADGDTILAVIRGSAVNQDGFSSGLTVPNKLAQEAVIRTALKNAGVKPCDVHYVEAHGTGTSLGDPIEARALAAVLAEGREVESPFWLGSVKTNIGHAESAAGIAGLIKCVLALHNNLIPPHLHFETPSPLIDWQHVPARIPTQAVPWSGPQRIAAVSAFGASGTNAHAVLEAAPQLEKKTSPFERPLHLLTLSAKTPAALQELAHQTAETAIHTRSLADLCYSANTGRAAFNHRLAVSAASTSQLTEQLAAFTAADDSPGYGAVDPTSPPRIAFLFTGHGSQYLNMGRGLFETAPVFRQAVLECEDLLKPYLDHPISRVLYPAPADEAIVLPLYEGMKYTQPAQFVVAYGLICLWRSFGIEPAAVLGHSVGEYAAAYAAGIMDLPSCIKLVAARGRLMEQLPQKGVMAAVFADEATVNRAIAPYSGQVAIAVINGPTNIVISGTAGAVEAIQNDLAARDIKTRRLDVAQASHSPIVDPMLDEFERIAATISFHEPRIAYLSGMNTRWSPEINPAYWRAHQRQAVRFGDGLQALLAQGYNHLIEIGPSNTLLAIAQRNLEDLEPMPAMASSLRKNQDDWSQLLLALADLYLHGASIDWQGYDRPYTRSRVNLPLYPFQHQRYWLAQASGRRSAQAGGSVKGQHNLLGRRLRTASQEVIFETELNAQSPAFLADHAVLGQVILPATAYIEMLRAAGQALIKLPAGPLAIEDLVIHAPLRLVNDQLVSVQTIASPKPAGEYACQVFSGGTGDGEWTLHASASLRAINETPATFDLPALRAGCGESLPVEEHYQRLAERGLVYGPAFRGLTGLWRGDLQAIGRVELPEALAAGAAAYGLHPALLDAALQTAGVLLPPGSKTYLPLSVETLKVYGPLQKAAWSLARLEHQPQPGALSVLAEVTLLDDQGRVLAELNGFAMKQAAQTQLDSWFYEVQWQPAQRPALPGAQPLAAALQPIFHNLAQDAMMAVYQREFLPRMDALCAALIGNALLTLGWNYQPGTVLTTDGFARLAGILPQHHRLLNRLLEVLAEEGVLAHSNAGWQVQRGLQVTDPSGLAAELRRITPIAEIEVDLVERIGRELAPALTGKADPLELMFPGGSLDNLEKLYRYGPITHSFNLLMAQAARILVESWPKDRPLRILEIGAGTGGTTAHVLEPFAARLVEYTFTDVSPLFLNKARQKFSGHDFIRYQVLDIEQDPESQGFQPQSFDLVLATNVLHATANITQTVQRAQRLLAPGGLLLAVEGIRKQRFADLVVGLTSGWWSFNDVDLRSDYALLSQAQWLKLFDGLGFQAAEALSGLTTLANQSLLIAEAALTPLTSREPWLIFSDQHPLGSQLIERLAGCRQPALAVRPGPAFSTGASGYEVNPGESGDFVQLLQTSRPGRIIYLWPLDETTNTPAVQASLCGGLLHLVQAIIDAGSSTPLWVITQGAVSGHLTGGSAGAQVTNPQHATLWGLIKDLRQEHPQIPAYTIDLDPDPLSLDENLDHLWAELAAPGAEDQLLFRSATRLQPRLARLKLQAQPASEPVHLVTSEETIDALAYRSAPRRSPGPGEVEIRVAATGIGFRDVLNSLDMYPGGGPLGCECAGIVSAVGARVENVQPGDAVIAVALDSFATFAIASAHSVVRKPAHLTFAEAAGVPSAFLTTWYALHHLARIKTGDRILIQAAAGGIGQAAVQLARQAGAEIFATAGSPAKRDLLKRMGVQQVFDSRSLAFASEIMAVTHGQGVDIVLNSLAGDFIPRSVDILAEQGRFIELGKRGILSAEQFAALKPGGVYAVVDLLRDAQHNPALIEQLFAEVMPGFENRTLQPLPTRTFSSDQAIDAFRLMAAGQHTGKLVLLGNTPQPAIRSDATYLITGGLGGLGLAVAEWLAQASARHLALIGRHAPREQAQNQLQALRNAGVDVRVFQADAAQYAELQAVFTQIAASMPPLKGIIHAAGLLDDGILSQQRWQRFETVFAPKVQGGWNLYELSKGLALDFFTLFSSAVSLIGSPGQANHVAACTFLDALAHYGRAQGVPAQSIGWGPWEQIGAAAEREVADRLSLRGIETIPPGLGIEALAKVLASPTAVHAGVIPMQWARFPDPSPFFNDLKQQAAQAVQAAQPAQKAAAQPQAVQEGELWKRLESAPESKRLNMVLAHVRDQALKVLNLPADFQLDQHQPLQELGLDSLMAVELRNLLGKGLPLTRKLHATLVFDHPTSEALARYLVNELFANRPAAAQALPVETPVAPPPTQAAKAAGEVDVEDLTDEEAEALLLAELEDLKHKKTGK